MLPRVLHEGAGLLHLTTAL